MSILSNLSNGTLNVADSKKYLTAISEDAKAQLMAELVRECYSPGQVETIVSESAGVSVSPIEERAMLKLSGVSEGSSTVDLAVVQCAMEDGSQAVEQLKLLWATESAIMEELRESYADQATARMEAVREECECSGQQCVRELANGIQVNKAQGQCPTLSKGVGQKELQKDPNPLDKGIQGNILNSGHMASMHTIKK